MIFLHYIISIVFEPHSTLIIIDAKFYRVFEIVVLKEQADVEYKILRRKFFFNLTFIISIIIIYNRGAANGCSVHLD